MPPLIVWAIGRCQEHVGRNKCVSGKVLRVKVGAKGVHFIDFCEEQMACPFTVVVFPSDLKDVGDVRRLTGHMIEIRGRGEALRWAGRNYP